MRIHQRIARWRHYRTLVREMLAYRHHELGIVRADIDRIARDAAFHAATLR